MITNEEIIANRFIPEDEALDAALQVLAEAQVKRKPSEGLLIEKLGLPPGALLEMVLRYGLAEIDRNNRHNDRLRLKVLNLDPEHYDEIARKIKADGEQPTPAQVKYQQKQAAKEVVRRTRIEKANADFAVLSRKINLAFTLYDTWTLSGGVPLGDSTREGLLAECRRERQSADGHGKNAAFYEELASRLTDGQRVRDGIDLDRAHRIRELIYEGGPDLERAVA